ncbi:MAG: outer membrane protein assembly factor BamE [Desulfobacterales bacterium]|nr:outer membrane protein assembly factor BamE [Desulfobacterales bacterium]
MERKKFIYLFLLVALFLVFSSCHPRHVSDIKPNMTKEEVASLWGKTPLITHRTVNGKAVETWEYHFSNSDSVCWVTFSQDRVATTQCRPLRGGTYYGYSQPGQNKAGPRASERGLVREGYFAMELAEVLRIGEVKSEAEAESRLASLGIAPKNGWIADYPMTPNIIGELRNAVGEASGSGKIAMNREEAIRAFDDLITGIESQNAEVEPPPGREPYPGPYYYPRFYYYPYYYPYPYTFGGYYRFHYPYRRHWR